MFISKSVNKLNTHFESDDVKDRKLTLALMKASVSNISNEVASISKQKPEFKCSKRILNMLTTLHQQISDKEISLKASRVSLSTVVEEASDLSMILESNSAVGNEAQKEEYEKALAKRKILILRLETLKGMKHQTASMQLQMLENDINAMKLKLADDQNQSTFDSKMKGFERTLNKKLSASPIREGSFKTVVIPIQAQFKSRMITADKLNEAGIKADRVTLRSGKEGSSITVLPEQLCLTFSDTYAESFVQEKLKEEDITAKTRSIVKKKNAAQKAFKLATEEDEKATVLLELYRTKAEASKDPTKLLGKNKFWLKRLKAVELTQKELKRSKKELEEIMPSFIEIDKKRKKQKIKEKKSKLRDRIHMPLLTSILDLMNENSSLEYTVVTSKPIKSPKNSDSLLFWIMPSRQLRALKGAFGDMDIVSWNLPIYGSVPSNRTR